MSKSIQELLDTVQPERRIPFRNLHETIVRNLPNGFEPGFSYGGLGYVVPHTLYPAGYHCKPTEPLPFAGIASQKNSINFYHMGIYADPALLDGFLRSILATVPNGLIWVKVASASKKSTRYPST